MPSNKTNKQKKKKNVLVFNEKDRKEFLTGFRKRKNQRRKQAQIDIELKLKEEKKRIKDEAKESYKKMTKSYQSIPELDELLEEKEYDTENVTVKVLELSTLDLAKQNNWIGENRPRYSEDENSDVEQENEVSEEIIPGMELVAKPTVSKTKTQINNTENQKDTKVNGKSKKELEKSIKFEVENKLKKIKAFKIKSKLVSSKDKKRSRRMLIRKNKFRENKNKKRGSNFKKK